MRRMTCLRPLAAVALLASLAACASSRGYDVEEKSLAQVSADLESGDVTAEALTRAYLRRIERLDRNGPRLNSVLAVNPRAVEQARALDVERRSGRIRGPLHGVPVLIKDNIEAAELPTTAGSLALAENRTGRDAPVVARLRGAGAVILGKTNLSEWANIRSSESISGWSAVGGQTRNPYAFDRNPCGSSSGSGVAAAASLAAAAVGTETDGSVVCPSAVNGIVGLKPTVGLISRTRVIPISASQDTPGPMARTVQDAAVLLDAMAGSDPEDQATVEAGARKADYLAALDAGALSGRRIGVLRWQAGFDSEVDAVFERALADLRASGAVLVDVERPAGWAAVGEAELPVLLHEFKRDLNAYLAATPAKVRARTLSDLIAFNTANADRELPLFGQDLFERAESGRDAAAYNKARANGRRLAGAEGLDSMLKGQKLDALVAPTLGTAWLSDPVNGDQYVGGGASRLAAVSGYPHLTVPMGFVRGLPVGLSFTAEAWSEAKLLALGYAYEQRAAARRPPRYLPTISPDLSAKARPQLVATAPISER
jgi:amidase